jgi:nicotinamidase-related amidase
MDRQREATGLVFWDVDTQIDFMTPPEGGGKLYVRDVDDPEDEGAQRIVPAVERLSSFARDCGILRVATGDWHLPDHPEIDPVAPDLRATFPPHCMAGEVGAMKIPQTELRDPLTLPLRADLALAWDIARRAVREGRDIFLQKESVGCFSGNRATEALLTALNPRAVVVYGVALDRSVAEAVEGMLEREWDVYVALDATWSSGLEAPQDLVARWDDRGAVLTSTQEVVTGQIAPTREVLENRMGHRMNIPSPPNGVVSSRQTVARRGTH